MKHSLLSAVDARLGLESHLLDVSRQDGVKMKGMKSVMKELISVNVQDVGECSPVILKHIGIIRKNQLTGLK